jgi:hypothetical protein
VRTALLRDAASWIQMYLGTPRRRGMQREPGEDPAIYYGEQGVMRLRRKLRSLMRRCQALLVVFFQQ